MRQPLTKRCEFCGREFETKPSHYARRRFCSYACRNRGAPNHPKGRIYVSLGYAFRGRHERVHRQVMAEMLCRPLRPNEVVHHRNGNRLDNRPENLEIMTRAEHMRRHEIPGWNRGQELVQGEES